MQFTLHLEDPVLEGSKSTMMIYVTAKLLPNAYFSVLSAEKLSVAPGELDQAMIERFEFERHQPANLDTSEIADVSLPETSIRII